MLVVGVAGSFVPMPSAHATLTTRNPEDLLIVDCLLPGQVRKLGRSATYMSARRPIRTTQADCEIRGGEYVSYDRANYQTALKVWMGQADGGDAEAQNYVGEIYMKGLGTAPDYVKAAEWFEKAAAQNNKRARINLGYLYEQGLGVEKDMAKALNLYREASGIDNDKLVFASTVTAQVQEAKNESAALREQLAAEQKKSEQLRAQVGKLQSDLQSKQKSYQKAQNDLDSVRRKLDAEQARVGIDTNPDFMKLQGEAQAREQDLSSQRDALKAERDASARQLADAEDQIAKLRAREQALLADQSTPGNDKALAALRQSAHQMDTALRDSRQRMEQVQQQLSQNEQQRQDAQAKFDQARVELAREHAKNESARNLLKLMEAQLSEKRQELASQRTQMASLQAQLDGAKYASLPPGFATASLNGDLRVEILQPALSVTRGLNKPAASVPPSQDGIEVVGRVQAPAGLTSLSLNGQIVQVGSGGVFKMHVPLSGGDNTAVRVDATDKSGSQAILNFLLVPGPGKSAALASRAPAVHGDKLPSGVRLGKYYALIIGNDNYAAFPTLRSASEDAKAIAGVLQSRYGYDVQLLNNANRFEILSALNDMRETLTDKDNLLVYYAGHGEIDTSQQGYWLPVDAQLNQPNSWISNRAVSDILTTMQARHVLVIADSCYSGTMTRSSLARFGGMSANVWGDWVKTMVAGRSRTALTSGGVQPVADTASKGGHSVFATALLTVLRDNNQLLTGQDLFREIAAGMALRSANAGLQQAPEYAPIQFAGHEAGEFFLMPEGARRSSADLGSGQGMIAHAP